ncbi:MAG: hypothetical protein JWP01_4205 [Myxococcales bacterium]|nr:hypothetical protein [Myxococcales bacterium]
MDLLAVYRTVKDSDNTSYLLSSGLQIVRVNTGWTKFALENGGGQMLERWGRNSALLDAVPPVLRDLYRTGFAKALATGVCWEHDYECSSHELFREFRMYAYPIHGTLLTVTHSLRVQRPHDREARPAADAIYRSEGLIRMCSYCRRVRANDADERWDWVPSFVEHMPPGVSHGICRPCAAFHQLATPAAP